MNITENTMMLKNDAATFNSIVSTMDAIQKETHDVLANRLSVTDGIQLTYRDDDRISRKPLSDFAFSQCCTHMGVPTSYMQRCFEKDAVGMVDSNLNYWLKQSDKTFLIREYKDHVRGMLTEKYTQFDAPEILDVVGNIINPDDYNIVGHYATEERLHIRMRELDPLPIAGEDLFGGLTIDSSDVGRCGFRISYFVYKQVCTNGLCISKGGGVLYSQKHIGIKSDEVARQIASNLENLPFFRQEIIDQINRNKGKALTEAEMEKIFAKLKTQQAVGDKRIEEIRTLMETRYDHSRFGLINGITEVAQKYSLDKRIDLEKFAGQLLMAAA